jgi:hypothetical protein
MLFKFVELCLFLQGKITLAYITFAIFRVVLCTPDEQFKERRANCIAVKTFKLQENWL